MGKVIAGFIGVLASIAVIVGTLVALNVIHPFPTQNPPTLIVSPASIKAESDCIVQHTTPVWETAYSCQEAFSESGQGNLTWSASGGLGAKFTPQYGTLEPGQSLTVVISITVSKGIVTPATCPTTTNLIFTNETNSADTVIVPWSC